VAAAIAKSRSRGFVGTVWVATVTTNRGIQKTMDTLGYTADPGVQPYAAPNGEILDSLWYCIQ